MYAELHAKTNFSFLEGASHPDELVRRAAELGYRALAVTDRNSLAGVVRAHGAAKDAGLKLIVGAEITPDDAPPVVLWATDRAAYGRLARLITQGRRRAEKGECRLSLRRRRRARRRTAGGNQLQDWRVESANCRSDGARIESQPICNLAIFHSPLSTLRSPLLPRPLRRPLLPAGRTAPRAGRSAAAGAAAGNLAADAASRWRRPATCIITCPSGRRCTTC